ncbi:MAG: DUF1634 domain-containing protein [Chloroflexota bacterium]
MSQRTFGWVVATVLRVGVTLSATLVVGGMIGASLVGWGGASGLAEPTDFDGLLERLRAAQPLAVTQLGLVVLILTPVVRVACSVVGFLLERDWAYVLITMAVLAVLVSSLLLFR